MRVYFAGPLFSEAEREFNLTLTKRLETKGFEVFLPQRNGVEPDKPPYSQMSKEERRHTLFNLDVKEIEKSDIFLFILDGRVPDEGACVELGMAYMHKKNVKKDRKIIGLMTDSRAAFIGAKLNPMLKLCFDQIHEKIECLVDSLSS